MRLPLLGRLDSLRRLLSLKARTGRLRDLRTAQAHLMPSSGPRPWLDRPDAAQRIDERLARGELTADQAEQCRRWVCDGYVIAEGLIDPAFLDQVWHAYEAAVRAGTIALQPEKAGDDDPHPGRSLNPHRLVPALRRLLEHPSLLALAGLVTGRPPVPFQTITAHKGSQQAAHSDSIHMTTHPLGYLTAAWIAFEDIDPDSGPLVYYPGSHRLPYLFSHQLGLTAGDFRTRGYAGYAERYEPAVRQLITERALVPEYFTARKGDVLFWHANLLHGGSARRDLRCTRRSVVCHYYARGVLCYHDLSGKLSGI
jgi:hypothetical protein